MRVSSCGVGVQGRIVPGLFEGVKILLVADVFVLDPCLANHGGAELAIKRIVEAHTPNDMASISYPERK